MSEKTAIIEPDTIYIRVSDNVCDNKDFTVTRLRFSNVPYIRVVSQWIVHDGMYHNPDFTGWDIERILHWLRYDSTGSHPEDYHEINIDGTWLSFEVDYDMLEFAVMRTLESNG